MTWISMIRIHFLSCNFQTVQKWYHKHILHSIWPILYGLTFWSYQTVYLVTILSFLETLPWYLSISVIILLNNDKNGMSYKKCIFSIVYFITRLSPKIQDYFIFLSFLSGRSFVPVRRRRSAGDCSRFSRRQIFSPLLLLSGIFLILGKKGAWPRFSTIKSQKFRFMDGQLLSTFTILSMLRILDPFHWES